MKTPIFTGVGTALITPMNKDGSVNFHKLRELVDYQINNGISAIIACGTTGESATLDTEEHVAVIKEVIRVTAARVPVIAGTGSNDTKYGAELSLEAQTLGADALLMVTPYYNKTSQAGLVAHYNYIADKIDIPVILYNVPSRTGTNIKPETYEILSHHKNITAIKEANGDISALAKTISLCGDSLTVYSGNDDQLIPMISLGAKGVISVASNVIPDVMSEMCAKALNGNFTGAVELQNKYLDFMETMFIDVNPIPVKEAMNLVGFDVGECRLPLCPTDNSKRAKIRACLENLEII